MNGRRMGFHILICVYWLLPFSLPLAYLAMKKGEGTLPASPGISWLSLPPDLVESTDPLRGWGRIGLTEAVPDAPPARGGANPGITGPPGPAEADRLARIELRGRVEDDGTVLYCFFDTGRSRWFRITPGSIDREAGVALLRSGDGLVLRDLEKGNIRKLDWMNGRRKGGRDAAGR